MTVSVLGESGLGIIDGLSESRLSVFGMLVDTG